MCLKHHALNLKSWMPGRSFGWTLIGVSFSVSSILASRQGESGDTEIATLQRGQLHVLGAEEARNSTQHTADSGEKITQDKPLLGASLQTNFTYPMEVVGEVPMPVQAHNLHKKDCNNGTGVKTPALLEQSDLQHSVSNSSAEAVVEAYDEPAPRGSHADIYSADQMYQQSGGYDDYQRNESPARYQHTPRDVEVVSRRKYRGDMIVYDNGNPHYNRSKAVATYGGNRSTANPNPKSSKEESQNWMMLLFIGCAISLVALGIIICSMMRSDATTDWRDG